MLSSRTNSNDKNDSVKITAIAKNLVSLLSLSANVDLIRWRGEYARFHVDGVVHFIYIYIYIITPINNEK